MNTHPSSGFMLELAGEVVLAILGMDRRNATPCLIGLN